MKRCCRVFLFLCACCCLPVNAQSPLLIGVVTLAFGPPPTAQGIALGLKNLGYTEYEDFVIGSRFASGDPNQLDTAYQELLADGVELFVSIGVQASLSAARVVKEKPVVFTTVPDPVKLGLVDSFALPGGNMTGIATLDIELDNNRLQKFKQLLPDLKRALLPYPSNPEFGIERIDRMVDVAQKNGFELKTIEVVDKLHASAVLESVADGQYDGIISVDSPVFNLPGLILDAGQRAGIATMFNASAYVDYGGFASYGTSFVKTGEQAARLIAQIMAGKKPGSLPIEADQNFEFTVNLTTAKKLEVGVPPEILFQATRVVR